MARPVGRPSVGPRISVRLDADLLARIDVEAAASGQSRATTIRRLLDQSAPESGVDVAQIRRALALTPAERIRSMVRAEHELAGLRGRAGA